MKSMLFVITAVLALAACSKKEEAPAPVAAPAAASTPAPAASEPAKTEEVKK